MAIGDGPLKLHEDGRYFVELHEDVKQVRFVLVWHDLYHAIEFHDKLVHHLKERQELIITFGKLPEEKA